MPRCAAFKPVGIPASSLQEVVLTVDELETIRLADLSGLYQEQAAHQMNISRQTFGRIVDSAHRKIAEALIQGKVLRIQGGEYEMIRMRHFACFDCKHIWEIPSGTGRPQECPACKSLNIHGSPEDGGSGLPPRCGRGRCHRGRHGMRMRRGVGASD